MQDNPMLRKIRGLLETAESYAATGNDDAASTFTEKAHALLDKYGFDIALVKDSGAKPDQVVFRTLRCDGKFHMRWSNLLHRVCLAQSVRSVHNPSKRDSDGKWHDRNVATVVEVIGFESDVDAIELLWTSLTVQASSALRIAMRACPTGVNRWTFQINFLDAFTSVVGQRLTAQRNVAVKEREAAEKGNLLPVLLDRKRLVDDAVNERYGKSLRNGRSYGARTSYAGHGAGAEAGSRASLGGTSLPSSRKALNG